MRQKFNSLLYYAIDNLLTFRGLLLGDEVTVTAVLRGELLFKGDGEEGASLAFFLGEGDS